MSTVLDEFIADARAVDLETVAKLSGVNVRRKGTGKVRSNEELSGPCPRCGGTDRFSINYGKGLWNCGHLGGAGGDGIALVAHCRDFDLRRRDHFLEACAIILGRDIPSGGERESAEDRAARELRLAAIKASAEADARDRAEEDNAFRQKAIEKGRSFYFRAVDALESEVSDYLRLRTGFEMPRGVFENLRLSPRHGYWSGRDESGHAREIHVGPAQIAPFVTADGKVTGCHETWIDLSRGPKFRPDLGEDDAGLKLPTKKAQGSIKGALIPLLGDLAALRWVGGEGIENVLAIAGVDGFRADTFYFAAGSLGNLAGPADPASSFTHPTLKKPDRNDRLRAVPVAGVVPKAGSEGDAAFVLDHVRELVLVCDGDSEPVATAAAVARAMARHARDGRTIRDWWPPRGRDWSGVILEGLMRMGKAA